MISDVEQLNSVEISEENRIDSLIEKYKVHYENAEDLWKKRYEHHITVEKDVGHLNTPGHRLSERMKEFVCEKVLELLEKGIIEHLTSRWNSLIVCAKKNESSGLCIDFLNLNAIT